MKTRLIRLRFRRQFRESQRQAADISTQAEQQIERHLFRRFGRLAPIRRFVAAWISLLLLLIGAVVAQNLSLSGYYQTLQTVPGGIYNEGVKGRFTTASPLYAVSEADVTVSRLIFAGLMTYDTSGRLVGDLAEGYSVDASGSTYTIRLRPGLKWHDGKPLTSADVVFTYQAIQNPDARSPLQASWQGIEITAPDPQTVVFKLPGGLAAFPYNMTNGIVPKHLLEKVPVPDLRSADFNTVNPVGAGPFSWQAVEVKGDGNPANAQQHIGLEPFEAYQGGKPKLQKFVVQVYANEDELVKAFEDKQLTAVEGLSEMPKRLAGREDVRQNNLLLRAANMVFFKASPGVLSETPVRQALVLAADINDIVDGLGYPTRPVRAPFLIGQVGYDQSLAQANYDLKAAKSLLDASGWPATKGGVRVKDGKPLSFTLTAADMPESRYVAGKLKDQWKALGVKVETQFFNAAEFQSSVTNHGYEALLNGISIGPDPDVFVYWDSSQADVRSANRLNLSEYTNSVADAALEAGRTRLDPSLRAIKYRPFLQAWQQDAPALGLYQPRVLYLTNGFVSGLTEQPINTAVDRFINVHNWKVREARVTN